MNTKTKLLGQAVVIFFLFSACSIGNNGNQPPVQNALTSAAETVSVQLTTDSATSIANIPPATETPIVIIATAIPSSTPVPLATNTATQVPIEEPCDNVQFVSDVTVEDGTDYSPGEAFTKTWRLKNIGTCPWTSEYDLVFYGGDAMGGPASQPLTAVDIATGVTVDISVDLVAPVDEDRYNGEWILRNDAGILFGMSGENPFWVEIEVVDPVVAPIAHSITIVETAHGSVRSDNSVLGVMNVGDTSSNVGSQGFVKFDLSAIPDGATITDVALSVVSADTLGDPFGELGCVKIYPGTYFPLDASDYAGGAIAILVNYDYCSMAEINADLSYSKSTIQGKLASDLLEFRFRIFSSETNSDAIADMVRFGIIHLEIEYEIAP
jgi:hypothetical protein